MTLPGTSLLATRWVPLTNALLVVAVMIGAAWTALAFEQEDQGSAYLRLAKPILDAARAQRATTGRYPAGAQELLAAAPPSEAERLRGSSPGMQFSAWNLRYELVDGVASVRVQVPPSIQKRCALPGELVYRDGEEPPKLDRSFWAFIQHRSFTHALVFGLVLAAITWLLWRLTAWQVAAIHRRGGQPSKPLASWERAFLFAGSLLLTAPAAAFAGMLIVQLCVFPHH